MGEQPANGRRPAPNDFATFFIAIIQGSFVVIPITKLKWLYDGDYINIKDRTHA